MSEDPNREIRTMVLLTLPYPPIPVLAARVELDDARLQDEDEVVTSHSFIAKGIEEAILRNRPEENRARTARSNARAAALYDVVAGAKARGHTSLRSIASYLSISGIPSPRGGEWSAMAVSRLLKQMEAVK